MARPKLELESSTPPVTALAFLTSSNHDTDHDTVYLLAGEDNHLAMYPISPPSTPSPTPLLRLKIFSAQPIHGIHIPSPTSCPNILIWGGRSITALSRRHLEAALLNPQLGLPTPAEIPAPDLIYDAALSPDTPGTGVLVTGHNEVVPLQVVTDANGSPRVELRLKGTRSPSRSVLYSASVRWVDGRVLFVAGTVFGEIVVWTCDVSGTDHEARCRVLSVLEGHEGSIFGVDVLSVPLRSGRSATLLASCSDDRTVRVWDVTERMGLLAQGEACNGHVAKAQERETGFTNGLSDMAQRNVEEVPMSESGRAQEPIAVAMGHLSRIWKVRMCLQPGSVMRADDSQVVVYSFGEDATVIEWVLELDMDRWRAHLEATTKANPGSATEGLQNGMESRRYGRLVQRRTFANHSGKHIWAAALLQHPRRGPLLATGGADGKIVLHGVSSGVGIQDEPKKTLLEEDKIQSGAKKTTSFTTEQITALLEDRKIQRGRDVTTSFTAEEVVTLLENSEFHRGRNENISFTLEEVIAASHSSDQGTDIQANGGTVCNGEAQEDPADAKQKTKKPLIYNYAFISQDCLLAVASSGKLFVGHFSSSPPSWSRVSLSDNITQDLKSYPVLTGTGYGVVLLGTATGGVYFYNHETGQVFSLGKFPHKIQAIFVLCSEDLHLKYHPPTRYPFRAIFTMMGSDEVIDLMIWPMERRADIYKRHVEKGSNISSACVCGQYLILGTRKGYLHLMEDRKTRSTPPPVYSFRTQSRDSVLSITPVPGQATRNSFLATFRDGKYRIFDIFPLDTDMIPYIPTATPRLHLIHECATPFGTVVHGAWFRNSLTNTSTIPLTPSKDLILSGFRGPAFTIWNETQQRDIASIDCGGANRTYTYIMDPTIPDRLRFVYTRTSAVHAYSPPTSHGKGSTHQLTIKPGAHGREIRAVARSSDGLIATGAEDTVLRIWRHDDADPAANMRCVSVLKQHDTGIQCLRWLGSSYLLSSGGAEELFVWRVSSLDSICYGGLAVVREAALPAHSKTRDLRVMSFDVEEFEGDGGGMKCMYITLVLSDSTIETWRYCPSEAAVEGAVPVAGEGWDGGGDGESWVLLAKGRYTGACPTQLRHLRVCGRDDGGLEVNALAAFTDGTVSVWRAVVPAGEGVDVAEFIMTSVVQSHQSAVKSLDLKEFESGRTDETRWLIITGGDDNALAFATLRLSHDPVLSSTGHERLKPVFEKRSRIASAHAAAITGIKVLDYVWEGREDAVIVTCSNDQRVKVWSIPDPMRSMSLARVKLLANEYSSVADPGDIEALGPDGRLVVVGVGVETRRLGDLT